jgi:hypothetical protein
MMARTTVDDREATAVRLLESSLDHSCEPSIDIDWDAPLVEGWGIPQHRSSQYGTALWDGLPEEQRRTLTMHDVVARNLVHPDVYRAVGIDPRVGRRAALNNPHRQETDRWSARKLVPFLREQEIIGGTWEYLWRQAHVV